MDRRNHSYNWRYIGIFLLESSAIGGRKLAGTRFIDTNLNRSGYIVSRESGYFDKPRYGLISLCGQRHGGTHEPAETHFDLCPCRQLDGHRAAPSWARTAGFEGVKKQPSAYRTGWATRFRLRSWYLGNSSEASSA